MLQKLEVKDGWTFRQTSSLSNDAAKEFLSVAQFPTVAHIDLLHHGLIPDPYIDDNEERCVWVNDANFTYQTESLGPVNVSDGQKAVLVFEGLDTIVDVYLNGEHILFSNNMHVSHRVDVTHLLADRKESSTLELRFRNAPEYARAEKKHIGYRGNPELGDKDVIHFGGSERLFVRKAQYHWGWDWGPACNTQGPWKPVFLEVYEMRFEKFLVTQRVAESLKSAAVTVNGSVEGGKEKQEVLLVITNPEGGEFSTAQVQTHADGSFEYVFHAEGFQLWHPHCNGDQPLYTVSASIPDHHSVSQRLGLRRLRLLQHPLKAAEGTSFVFEVNNIRTFCGGSCWIPGDYLLPRMNRRRYTEWLSLAKSGNQCMIRVWGGGIIESDDFYDLCDQMGILIWQDFLFACGNYPASDDFVKNVEVEAEQQMRRIGHHPSIAVWAGNNEDYMFADFCKWELDYSDEDGPWDKTNFPARRIYEKVLPAIHERLGTDVPYRRSSPYGGKTANDLTVGDTHIWNVWHLEMSPYQDYKKFTSRFVSEFGFESAPNLRTMHKAITNPKERYSQSRLYDIHDKGPGHDRRYGMYMNENFRFRMNPLKDFIYCTQALQAEAMKYAYNLWRREFRGPGQENCAGVLVWQLNDIWPGTSWALVDVDFNRKPAFFITKRALAKVVVGMERIVSKSPYYMLTSYRAETAKLDIWACNGYQHELDVILKLRAFDVESGSVVKLHAEDHIVRLAPNQTSEISQGLDVPSASTTVVVAYLEDPQTATQLARWVSWPEPLKLLHFKRGVQITTRVENDKNVVVTTDAPVVGVVLSVPIEQGEDAIFGDNYVDMVPGEEVRIGVEGLDGRDIDVRFLCDWERTEGFEL